MELQSILPPCDSIDFEAIIARFRPYIARFGQVYDIRRKDRLQVQRKGRYLCTTRSEPHLWVMSNFARIYVDIDYHIKCNPTESVVTHVPSVDSISFGILRRQVRQHLPVGSNGQPMYQNETQQQEGIAHLVTIGLSTGTNRVAEWSARQQDKCTEVLQ